MAQSKHHPAYAEHAYYCPLCGGPASVIGQHPVAYTAEPQCGTTTSIGLECAKNCPRSHDMICCNVELARE